MHLSVASRHTASGRLLHWEWVGAAGCAHSVIQCSLIPGFCARGLVGPAEPWRDWAGVMVRVAMIYRQSNPAIFLMDHWFEGRLSFLILDAPLIIDWFGLWSLHNADISVHL